MDDLISRQAAIDICRAPHMRNADCSDFEMEIMMLPPIQPKRGRWIYCEDSTADCVDGYRCDQCGFFVPWDYKHKSIDYIKDYNFCPMCGSYNGGDGMNIDQEKMIVEALPSLYPLKNFEEEAIHAVLDAIPKWIPVTERLPKSKEEDLEYPTVLIYSENEEVMIGCFYESTKEWGTGEYFDEKCNPIAWMPLPEYYKGVTT